MWSRCATVRRVDGGTGFPFTRAPIGRALQPPVLYLVEVVCIRRLLCGIKR